MKNLSSFFYAKNKLQSYLLLSSLMAFGSIATQAQSSSAVQNFDGLNINSDTELGYERRATVPFANGLTSADFTIPNVSLSTTGNRSWGVGVIADTILFQPRHTAAGSATNYIQFRLGAWGRNFDQGLDANDNVQVWVSVDGANPTRAITVTGRNGANSAYWDYSGTGRQTANYNSDINAKPTGNSVPSDFSIIYINLPSGRHTIRFYITAITSNADELWTIDEVIIGSSAPLPVELKSFTAEAATKGTQVRWSTASEKNNAGFEVQRGVSANQFETVARVAGNGTSSQSHNYEWLDVRPLAGLSYYRLRQLDHDGTESFSPVVTVQNKATDAAFFPNPTTGLVTLNASLGAVRYRVLNTLGQTMLTGETTGGNTVDMQQLRTGTYFLELQSAGSRTVQRFVRKL